MRVCYNPHMPRRKQPSRATSLRIPDDVATALDAFVESDPTLTKTETVGVALYTFMREAPEARTKHIASFRMRLYGTKK